MKHKVLLFITAMFIAPTIWAITPENGWWYNPAESGKGFNIEVQRDTVFIATFVYDETGTPIWYSGSGKLKDSTVTLTLLRFDGGQCIDCTYTKPTSSKAVGPVTVHFTSETSGTLSWQGETVPIERFNFALGGGLERLLGEWVITIGSPSFPMYLGARLTYREVSISDGKRYAMGSVSGSPSNPSSVSVFEDPQATGYQYLGMSNSSDSYYNYYAYSFTGLNKITGKTVIMKKTVSPEEVAKSLADGIFFVGYRNLDSTDLGVHRATAQAWHPPTEDASREAINALLSSLQNSRYTRYRVAEKSGNQRENPAIEMIAKKIYAQKKVLAN